MLHKLLILGSHGLIGSACQRLFSKDPSYKLLCPTHLELNLFEQDAVAAYFETHLPDYVILAAGVVGGILYNKNHPAEILWKNLRIQLNVFEMAHHVAVKKLLFFGSSCMYPKECSQPMSESCLYTGILESTSISYAVAKLAGVQLAQSYNEQYKTDRFLAVIPNTVYGPNDHFDPTIGHVIPSLIVRFHHAKEKGISQVILWGDGTPRREFIHSDDLASAVSFLLSHPTFSTPLNIGVGYDVTIQELALLVKKCVGYEGEIVWDKTQPNGTHRKLLDNQIISQMGWEHKIDLIEGVQSTYEWYKENVCERGALSL